jgi:hypothetical protein
MSTEADQAGSFADPRDYTSDLAEQCELPVDMFVETFGAGWQPMLDLPVDYDADPEGMGNIFGPWSVAGEPFQICLRPTDGGVELGMPAGRWLGHDLTWQVHRRESIPTLDGLEAAKAAVARILKSRRSTFHYCRYCRTLTPPENRLATDVCYGCASVWQGVVY